MLKTWDMETTHDWNDERTPLIENGARCNAHRQLIRVHATFIQAPLHGNEATYNEQTLPSGQGAASNLNARRANFPLGGTSASTDEAIHESQMDIDNIVETLFSIWLQFPPPRRSDGPECEDTEFFSPRALDAMSTAWRQIRAERNVLPEKEVIVQGLAASMVDYMYPLQLMVPEREENVTKEIFTAHVTKIVAECWQQILDGIEEADAHERARKKERRRRIREKLRRRKEIEEILSFYEPFARMDNHVPLDCRIFCLFLCQCCSIFTFQFPIHTLLLSWPLSIGIMGGMYLYRCPMSYLMPYVMMAMGAVGTIVLLVRLSLVIYEKFSENRSSAMWPWTVLKVMEFAFLDLLIIQLYYFFSKTPSFVPGSPRYCNETFYTFVHWINYASIALVSAWLFVYSVKGLLWWKSRRYALQ